VQAHGFQRVTTHVRLSGGGADGLGEDVSPHVENGTSLHETRPDLPLRGEWTIASFSVHLETLDLWPEPPEWELARNFRLWAFESAALDLALRLAGRPLHEVWTPELVDVHPDRSIAPTPTAAARASTFVGMSVWATPATCCASTCRRPRASLLAPVLDGAAS
jgi:hypothetical protein